jgi:hypothetical protein
MRNKQINATHNSSSANINFTSSVANNAAIQSWGIKDLMIVLKTCDISCTACFGPSSQQCIVCASGFYLIGNACVSSCPVYGIPKLNLCAISCPTTFFNENTTMTCQPCSDGCSACTGPLT